MLMISRVNVVDTFAKDIVKRKAFNYVLQTLREKCPNAEFFLVHIFLYLDQKNLRIPQLFTQWKD